MKIIKIGDKKDTPAETACKEAERLIKELQPFCQKIKIAGSLLRGHDTVGDLDIVIAANRELPQVSSALAINLFVTEERFFEPCFLHYAIGKAIIRLKSVAKEKGWKLDQEGLHIGGETITGIREIYARLGQKIPDCLKEYAT